MNIAGLIRKKIHNETTPEDDQMIADYAAQSPKNAELVEIRTEFAKWAILSPDEKGHVTAIVAKYDAITIDQLSNLFYGRAMGRITEEENDRLDFWIASMPGNNRWIKKLKSAGKYFPEVVKSLKEISVNMLVNLIIKHKVGKLSPVERRVLDLWGTFSAENIVFVKRLLHPEFGTEDNSFTM